MTMKILGALILVALAALAMLAALNWNALIAPVELSFAVFTTEGPLGLILLGFAMGLGLLFLSYGATLRTTLLVESRRHAQELHAQREIAEHVEASRIRELKLHLEHESAAIRAALEQAVNSLAASIGHLDDKLDRALQRPAVDASVVPLSRSEKDS
jgi:uncharacterized integral membrane protein